MKLRILLVNFGESVKQRLSKRGLEVDLGYLSDASEMLDYDFEYDTNDSNLDNDSVIPDYDPELKKISSQTASFYSPRAIFDYKLIFIRLTNNPPPIKDGNAKAKIIDKRFRDLFFRHWFFNRGIFVLFTEESYLTDLNFLGIWFAKLQNSIGNDYIIHLNLNEKNEYLKELFKELKTSISIPPAKYIIVPKHESELNEPKHWNICSPYFNNNKDFVGIYFDWGRKYNRQENPAYYIFPGFKDYGFAIEKILNTFSKLYSKWLPEIDDIEWHNNDCYYPQIVTEIETKRKIVTQNMQNELKILFDKKETIKKDYIYLNRLLTASGDELKHAVIKTLRDIFKLSVLDLDEGKKKNFREDILIKDNKTHNSLFAEVKGTKSLNPTIAYINQLQTNLLKRGNKDLVGALILNHCRNRRPSERPDAYSDIEGQTSIENIVYIDTRVLLDLSLAIIDHAMDIKKATEIIFTKGNVIFNLEDFRKRKI